MAKLVFGMNQSLDGYVDHLEFRPSPALFRHFIEQVRDLVDKRPSGGISMKLLSLNRGAVHGYHHDDRKGCNTVE